MYFTRHSLVHINFPNEYFNYFGPLPESLLSEALTQTTPISLTSILDCDRFLLQLIIKPILNAIHA